MRQNNPAERMSALECGAVRGRRWRASAGCGVIETSERIGKIRQFCGCLCHGPNRIVRVQLGVLRFLMQLCLNRWAAQSLACKHAEKHAFSATTVPRPVLWTQV